MLNDSILTLTTFVPAAGAVVVALLPRRGRIIQWFTLLVTLVTFGLTLHLPFHYLYGHPGFQFEVDHPGSQPRHSLSPGCGWHFPVAGGADRLSGALGVLASWKAINHRTKEFYFLFLLQQTAMIGVFRRPRYVSLLRLLGADAGADGDPDLHVRPGSRNRGGDQVFRLHVSAFRAAAGSDCLALRQDRYL